jgi:hypothetical protein
MTGASIGGAWTDRAVGCDAIVAVADRAMYEAKRGAGGPVLARAPESQVMHAGRRARIY